MTFNAAALAAPFPPASISWRAQSVSSKNPDAPKAMALAYIDARDVMNRLDDVCGPDGWEDSYVETALGRVICTIRIKCGEAWVSKSDGAGKTDVEGDKGGISDAFKRAAVKWGIGRYLYDMPTPWVRCELYNGKWSKWHPDGQRELDRLAGKAVTQKAPAKPAPTEPISDATRDWISDQLITRQLIVGDLCKALSVTSLKAITYAQLDAVKAWLRENSKKEAA